MGEEGRDLLRRIYKERGYLKQKQGTKTSHSGWEIRLATLNEKEARAVRKALRSLEYTVGKPYKKHSRIIIPIYGEDQVNSFLDDISVGKR